MADDHVVLVDVPYVSLRVFAETMLQDDDCSRI